MEAVRSANPAAKVEAKCLNTYPIKVTVSITSGGGKKELFSTDQRNLFSKYADRRQKAMAEIKAAVKANM